MMVTVVSPPVGSIDLKKEKKCPISEQGEPFREFYAVTRSVVDISKFQEKLRNLPSSIWEDECQEGNVKLIRPAHDKWGVKKIVFTFCDDFLQRVYDLPWSRLLEWREHLLPIYESIGIKEDRIVRCLLASMPPGMSIPVHHDTGYWVKKTHRVHCAIESGPEVDFLVGPTTELMVKYLFESGHVIELNNQAKHSVANNMINKWRVHLIFDYVDDDYVLPERILLKPGQRVNQTRRSIDLANEAGNRQSPSFLIIGAQKSGTTSLYEYLCQHPLVARGKRRETHFFDWRWSDKLSTPEAQLGFYMNFFEKDLLFDHPSLCTGESTPSYLLHSDLVIPRIKSVCPWAKILVIFRDPVERAYSQYQMCIDPTGTPQQLATRGMSSYVGKTFQQVVEEEIAELKELGITPDCGYDRFRERFLTSRPMNHGGHSIIARGLYALQLVPWLKAFGKSDLAIYSISQMKGGKEKVQSFVEEVYSFIGLPPHDLEAEMPGSTEAKNSRSYDSMDPQIRSQLAEFYRPYNERLYQLLEAHKYSLPVF